MKDKKLLFDRSCHVLYSRPCKKEIRAKIALHYPEAKRETVWEQVQRQYADFLSDWRTDLGGKKNFHNGVGGTYDCIAIMSYYAVCKAVTSFCEIEEMEENLILPIFRRLRFVDCNKPFWRKLMYRAFVRSKCGCDKWHDYEMIIAPYDKDKPIYYEFTSCPASDLRQTAYRQSAFYFIHWLEQANQCAELELERWNGPICIKVSNHVSEEVAWYARSTI